VPKYLDRLRAHISVATGLYGTTRPYGT
jgi:hypothetical protein